MNNADSNLRLTRWENPHPNLAPLLIAADSEKSFGKKDVSVINNLGISYSEISGLELIKRIFVRKQGDSPIASQIELCHSTHLKLWRKIRQCRWEGPTHPDSLPVFV